MQTAQVKITKVDETAAMPVPAPAPKPAAARPSRRSKTMKTFPKGILKKTAKIKPVRDPAKAPPVRKGVRKHTLRVMTEKGIEQRRKTIRNTVRKMSDDQLKKTLQKAGVSHNANTPGPILREIVESGMEAGMISFK